ncbi:MAG: tetratricopeptide repeat protein [bacterium]
MRTLIILAAVALSLGCQSATPTTAALNSSSESGEQAAKQTLTDAQQRFLLAQDFPDRLQRLLELEQQVLALAADQPLKLGSLGSAILDIYNGSLTGHFAMREFYDHVDSIDAKAVHEQALSELIAAMRADADGTRSKPYKALTLYDGHTLARLNERSAVGAIYQSNAIMAFGYQLVSRPQNGPLHREFFDISPLLNGLEDGSEQNADVPADHSQSAGDNPWTLIRLLAAQMDSAAQTAIGRYLASVQKYEDAAGWLEVAARSENVVANALLATIYWSEAEDSEDPAIKKELRERSLENHLHAIALGSTDSMYTVANLYINDVYGEQNRAAALPLLHRAADLQHPESLLYLGHLFSIGREVEQDLVKADQYFARAAALNDTRAILSYGRFLTSAHEETQTFSAAANIHGWLEKLAAEDNTEAMVLLGNLHARGLGQKASNRRAVNWYKKAVKANPEDGDIVNEVAWTLAVSDIEGLQRSSYAKRIMDNLMSKNAEAAQRPEYIDTWAAAHAANGDFAEAIRLQNVAIETATNQQRDDVIGILKTHLEKFEAGATIIEKAP